MTLYVSKITLHVDFSPFMSIWLKSLPAMSRRVNRFSLLLQMPFHFTVHLHSYLHVLPYSSDSINSLYFTHIRAHMLVFYLLIRFPLNSSIPHLSYSRILVLVYSRPFGLHNSWCSTFWNCWLLLLALTALLILINLPSLINCLC